MAISTNNLRYERAEVPMPHTHWRPVSDITYKGEVLDTQQLFDMVDSRPYDLPLEIGVEDPYHRHRLLGGFVIEPLTRTIQQGTQVAIDVTSQYAIAPFGVYWNRVKVGQDARIGRAELLSDVTVEGRVRVLDRTVIAKRSQLAYGVHILNDVYLDVGSHVGRGSCIGAHTTGRRGLRIDKNVYSERTVHYGRHVHINDDVHVEEDVVFGDFTVIGAGAEIGAGANVGGGTNLMPRAYVQTGEHIAAVRQMSAYQRRFMLRNS